MERERRWATIANGVTLLRLLLVPILLHAILSEEAGLACVVFFAAVATDLADGYLARRLGEATPLGQLVDHAVDATFVTAGTAALAWTGALPALLPALIATAFAQYAVDCRPAGGAVPRASSLGRWNGIAYYVIVAVPLVRDALGLPWPGPGLVQGLGWLLVASTLVSIADRLRSRA